ARAADHRAPRLPAPGTRAALTQLDRFRSDIWAALNYAANHEPLIALRLAAALPVWWRWRGQEAVGHRWLCRLLADGRTADADPALRARATIAAADLSGDPGEAAAVTQALGDVRRAGDVTGEVMARTVLRRLHQADGDYAAARAQAEAVLGVALRVGRCGWGAGKMPR